MAAKERATTPDRETTPQDGHGGPTHRAQQTSQPPAGFLACAGGGTTGCSTVDHFARSRGAAAGGGPHGRGSGESLSRARPWGEQCGVRGHWTGPRAHKRELLQGCARNVAGRSPGEGRNQRAKPTASWQTLASLLCHSHARPRGLRQAPRGLSRDRREAGPSFPGTGMWGRARVWVHWSGFRPLWGRERSEGAGAVDYTGSPRASRFGCPRTALAYRPTTTLNTRDDNP